MSMFAMLFALTGQLPAGIGEELSFGGKECRAWLGPEGFR